MSTQVPDTFPIVITIPGKPMGKGRPRFCRHRNGGMHTYTPVATLSREQEIGWLAKKAMAGRPLLIGGVQVEIVAMFVPPPSWSKKKREEALVGWLDHTFKPDSDNCAKLVLDALNKVVWKDDGQVVTHTIEKTWCASHPRTVVRISPMYGRMK
ncbi:MAG TPA: RusA family crossover junction endodeoxyribonuclease [Rhodospirillaceae bacterium]|nr:RusA family crossover junction endodeoxyribonuclease [Rhodospirillaceae bacterium]